MARLRTRTLGHNANKRFDYDATIQNTVQPVIKQMSLKKKVTFKTLVKHTKQLVKNTVPSKHLAHRVEEALKLTN